MYEAKPEMYSGNLENALYQSIRQAVRAEVQEIARDNEDRLLTIDQLRSDYRYPKTGSTGTEGD
jgi:hypothetical protein